MILECPTRIDADGIPGCRARKPLWCAIGGQIEWDEREVLSVGKEMPVEKEKKIWGNSYGEGRARGGRGEGEAHGL